MKEVQRVTLRKLFLELTAGCRYPQPKPVLCLTEPAYIRSDNGPEFIAEAVQE